MIITSRTLSSLALAGALCLPGSPVARAQVVADDVVCSKCVDDTDIARDSVGTAKIKDKSIQAVDLAPNSVGTAKIKDLSITSVDLAPNSVGTAKIKDGSITGDELAPDAVFGRILLIRADPLDPAGNCAALKDTLANITDNDADNRYTILLAPGVYDCGSSIVAMRSFVDIAGSGRGVTLVKGSLNSGANGVIDMRSDTELRHLTVEHAGGTDFAIGLLIRRTTNARVTDVAVKIAAPVGTIGDGIFIDSGTHVLRDLEITVSDASNHSYGILARSHFSFGPAIVTLENVVSRGATGGSGDGGLAVDFCPVEVTARNSVFSGSAAAIDASSCSGGASELNFVSSQLDGGLAVGITPPVIRCVGSYDGGQILLDAACN